MALPATVRDTNLPDIGSFIIWSPSDDAHRRGGYGAVYRASFRSGDESRVVAVKMNRKGVKASKVRLLFDFHARSIS